MKVEASTVKRRRRLKSAGSFSLYLVAPVLSAVTPLLVFPSVTRMFGESGLGAMGIAQSVGTAASVIGELGWAVVGPQRIAALSGHERARYVRLASASRLVALAVLLPLCIVIVMALAPEFKLESAIIGAGSAMAGLSLGWAWIGANRPSRMLFFESVPKLLLSVAAAGIISLGGSLAVYGVALIISALISPLAGLLDFKALRADARADRGQILYALREQAVVTGGRSITAGFTALPVTLIAVVSPAAVPLFTAIDRLARMSLSVLAAVPNRLQSWLGSAGSPEDLHRRNRQQLLMNGGMGIFVGVVYAILVPFVASLVFSGTVHIEPPIAWMSGLMIAVICLSRGLGLSLVAFGRAKWLLPSSAAACAVGICAVLGFGFLFGAIGGVAGVVSAEIVGAVVQAFALRRRRKA